MKKIYAEERQERVIESLLSLPYPATHSLPYTEIAFGEIFEIWAKEALCSLKKKAGSSFEILTERAEKKLFEKLVKEFSFRCAPTLAALLHNAKSEGKLAGNTPRERYLYFVETILPDTNTLKNIFDCLPRFAKTTASTFILWMDQAEELLTRLNRDLKTIEETFSPNKPLRKVLDLSPSLSDYHNGNRSVYQIEFEGGIKLIYKPKSLALDDAYNKLVEKLAVPAGLKTAQVLDREEYGWVEFIETAPCKNKADVSRFFERMGTLLCLVHVLEGTDCHYENLIACGEHPVLIDLESLFHPTVKKTKPVSDLDSWNHSVFRTAFLPSVGHAAQRRMDISPLSAEETQEIPRLVPHWEDVNTDQMQVGFAKKKVQISVPRPRYNGTTVSVAPYIPDLLRGFAKMYRHLVHHRKDLANWIEDLFNHPVRCIFRPTELYFQILQRLSDPKLMNSKKETDQTLEVLSRFSSSRESSGFERIIALEKEALLHGDIPFFLSSPNNTDLYWGQEIVAHDFFEHPAKESVKKKIERLNESDLDLQLQYIEQSLYFLKNHDCKETSDLNLNTPILTDKKLLNFADQIGEKILSLSQPLKCGTPSWVGLELDPTINRTIFQPISNNFYSGICGIAFFLGHLGKILKKSNYTKTANQLLDHLKKPYYEDGEAIKLLTGIGAFTGIGGLIYCLTSLGFNKEALHIASFIDKKKIGEDSTFDIVSGSAGLILALLALYEHTKEPSILSLAKSAGDHLLKNAEGKEKSLCGFSHGTGGIAYALLKLYEQTNEKAYLAGAEKGFAYESGLYSPKENNWPDLRKENCHSARSWCHGAPGIALSRLYSLNTLPAEEDLKKALESTATHLNGSLDHLCCGTFGKISVLWEASKKFPSENFRELAQKAAASILTRFEKVGGFRLFSDLPETIQNPGFMQGLSGIGYLLLRLTQTGENLPDALILQSR